MMDVKTYVADWTDENVDTDLDGWDNMSSGLSHGLDIAVNFAEWLLGNYIPHEGKWVQDNWDKSITSEQALQIYLTEINKK